MGKDETWMQTSVRNYLKRSLRCIVATRNFRFENIEFDAVGFNSNENAFHIVECKLGSKPATIGHAFGQLLAYQSVLGAKGYDFLREFGNRVRVDVANVATAIQEKKLRGKFYVALTEKACRNHELLHSMKQRLPFVGIIRLKENGACRNYILIGKQKDYSICRSELTTIPVRRIYSHAEFLDAVEHVVRDKLAGTIYSDYETSVRVDKPFGDWRKFWFQRRQFHFEVLLRKRKYVEAALHLEEADPHMNRSVCRYLRKRWKNIQKQLGKDMTMGRRGTKGWRHVSEHFPRTELTEDYVGKVAQRIAAYISVLEPMVEEWEKGADAN